MKKTESVPFKPQNLVNDSPLKVQYVTDTFKKFTVNFSDEECDSPKNYETGYTTFISSKEFHLN